MAADTDVTEFAMKTNAGAVESGDGDTDVAVDAL